MALGLGLGLGLSRRSRGVASTLATLRSRMTSGKVDFVGIGDSNQLQGGHGWDHGWQYALAQQFPMWATGLIAQNEGNGSGSGTGYIYNRVGSAGVLATTGAPAALAKYLDKGGTNMQPGTYGYLADGSATAAGYNSGLILSAGCPLNLSDALACDFYWGSFDTGAGNFKPCARKATSPYTSYSVGSVINTNTGALGTMQKHTLSLGADGARTDVQFSWNQLSGGTTAITGPFFCTWLRARNTNRTTGFAYSTLYGTGGQSARDMAEAMALMSNDTLTHFFSILRNDQGATKTIVIVVNTGVNDRSETAASYGSGITPGDSAAAFADNVLSIINRITAIWTLNGWPTTELYWLMSVSHPVSSPDDAELIAYRTQLQTTLASVAQSQALSIPSVAPYADFVSNGWYNSGGSDPNHLVQAGYETVSSRLIAI